LDLPHQVTIHGDPGKHSARTLPVIQQVSHCSLNKVHIAGKRYPAGAGEKVSK